MTNIDMSSYYKDTVTISRDFFSNAVSSYVDGIETLHAVLADGIDRKRKDVVALEQGVSGVYCNIPVAARHLVQSLQLWQESGATAQELCELAGANYKKLKHRIPANADFVDIIRKYQLDFKDAGKRTPTWEDDAPLTLAVLAVDDISQIRISRRVNNA